MLAVLIIIHAGKAVIFKDPKIRFPGWIQVGHCTFVTMNTTASSLSTWLDLLLLWFVLDQATGLAEILYLEMLVQNLTECQDNPRSSS